MEFYRTVRINAPLTEVWALVDEIPAVANCIPGLHDLQMRGEHEFDCVMTQRVGSVKASFRLHTVVEDIDTRRSVTAVSNGRDDSLGSTVRAVQRFAFAPTGAETEVEISADVQVTGKIATFGHRIIGAKAEQVTVETLRNVDKLLAERSAAASTGPA
jgi:uncharacterized protein